MGNELHLIDQLPPDIDKAAVSLRLETRIGLVTGDRQLSNNIRRLLEKYYPGMEVTVEAYSIDHACRLLQRQPFDWLIVDVELKDGAGYDLLDRQPQIKTPVVFIAGSYESAFRAFRYNTVDCLLKPLVPQEFMAAVQKVRQYRQSYYQLLQSKAISRTEKIALPVGAGYVFTGIQDITRLESCGNYSFVYFSNRTRCLVSLNLKELESMLPATAFFRSHQSHIVNVNYVRQLQMETGCSALMNDGAHVPVARRRKEEFLRILAG